MIIIALAGPQTSKGLDAVARALISNKDVSAQINTLFLMGTPEQRVERLSLILAATPHRKKTINSVFIIGNINTAAEAEVLRAANGVLWHLTPFTDIAFQYGDLWVGKAHPFSNTIEALAETRAILAERFLSTQREKRGGQA